MNWLMLSPLPRAAAGAHLFTQPFSLAAGPMGRGIPRDTMRRALALLADAGWKLSGQRLLDSQGAALRGGSCWSTRTWQRILQPMSRTYQLGVGAR